MKRKHLGFMNITQMTSFDNRQRGDPNVCLQAIYRWKYNYLGCTAKLRTGNKLDKRDKSVISLSCKSRSG